MCSSATQGDVAASVCSQGPFAVGRLVSQPLFFASVCGGAFVASLLLFLYGRGRRASRVRVCDIFIYPIKGCAGIRVSEAAVTPRGLDHDRMLMVVRKADGAFQTQRQLPRMATIRPLWDEAGDLVLTAPGVADFHLDQSHNQNWAQEEQPLQRRTVRVWKHTVTDAVDCGDEVAAWFSAVLGVPDLRLVRMPDGHRRPVSGGSKGHTGVVSFADGYPVLLASESSREAVRAHAGLSHVSMRRFRPNVVVETPDLAPFEEMRWRHVEPGDVAFDAPIECRRCQVPRIDPASGVPDSLPEKQPTTALNTLTKNHFGVYLTPLLQGRGCTGATIRTGDHVRVVRTERKLA